MYWYLQVEDVKGNKNLNEFVACLVNFSLLHPCTAFNKNFGLINFYRELGFIIIIITRLISTTLSQYGHSSETPTPALLQTMFICPNASFVFLNESIHEGRKKKKKLISIKISDFRVNLWQDYIRLFTSANQEISEKKCDICNIDCIEDTLLYSSTIY